MNLRAAIAVGVLGVAGAALVANQRARASCSAPTKCTIAEIEVRSCKVFEPEKDPQLARYAAELRKQKQDDRARALFDSYRGVVVEVQEKNHKLVDCRSGTPARASYDDSAYPLDGFSPSPTAEEKAGIRHYFAPTRDANACAKRFPEKRAVRMLAARSCCDGDPNPPCMMSR